MTTARMGRYALAQLRDWLLGRGVGILLILVALSMPFVVAARQQHGVAWAMGDAGAERLRVGIGTLLAGGAPLLAVVAFGTIVAFDRRQGFTRFLFAKPVAPPRYYLQAFAVAYAGVALVVALFLGGVAVAFQPVLPSGSLAYLALRILADGALLFLCSVLFAQDVIAYGAVLVASALLQSWLPDQLPSLAPWILMLLPPSQHADTIARTIAAGRAAAFVDVAWMIGWSAAILALGAMLLRRRPLAP